ncbi:hypothetical protein Tco_0895606 [Tanacetum coccineum]|uniref:Uncharacterized protein n=1 Tax=Tanacetum coccineum TaxID=301880 RepID=A0ABQ5CG92_9ASTR
MEYLHGKFQHHHHHHVDEMTCREDEKIEDEDGWTCLLPITSKLFGEDLIWSKSDGLTFKWGFRTVYHDTFKFRSVNIVRVGRSLDRVPRFLDDYSECKSSHSCYKMADFVRNFEDLTELSKSESYELLLNHKGDEKIAIFIGLITTRPFVNVAIFNGFVEFGNGRGDAGDFGYFWDVGFSKGYIVGSGSWHFVT